MPHGWRNEGFPLDSLSIELNSGSYYYDLHSTRRESDIDENNGYRSFFRRVLPLLRND